MQREDSAKEEEFFKWVSQRREREERGHYSSSFIPRGLKSVLLRRGIFSDASGGDPYSPRLRETSRSLGGRRHSVCGAHSVSHAGLEREFSQEKQPQRGQAHFNNTQCLVVYY